LAAAWTGEFQALFEDAALCVGIIEAATKLTSQGDYGVSHKCHEELEVA
jgi:hypothetical protein